MATIPQRELRNNVSDVLRRAEAGEDFEITVDGRPVARLSGIVGHRQFVPAAEFMRLFDIGGPLDTTFFEDVSEGIDHELYDPYEPRP